MQPDLELLVRLFEETQIDVRHLVVGYQVNETIPEEDALDIFLWKLERLLNWDYGALMKYRFLYVKYDTWIVWDCNTNCQLGEVVRQCLQAERCSHLIGSMESSNGELATLEMTGETNGTLSNGPTYPLLTETLSDLKEGFWYKPGEPNFILCQRVRSTVFNRKFKEITRTFCDREPRLRQYFYAPEKFHMTLCVFSIRTLEEAQDCFDTIDQTIEAAVNFLPYEPLRLCGLGTTAGRMLYVPVAHSRMLQTFITILTEALDNAGFITNVQPHFYPHITLMKFPAAFQEQFSIPNDWLNEFEDVDFGDLILNEFHFCLRTAGPDGFYRPLGRIVIDYDSPSSTEI